MKGMPDCYDGARVFDPQQRKQYASTLYLSSVVLRLTEPHSFGVSFRVVRVFRG
jgi:hypothetical protein